MIQRLRLESFAGYVVVLTLMICGCSGPAVTGSSHVTNVPAATSTSSVTEGTRALAVDGDGQVWAIAHHAIFEAGRRVSTVQNVLHYDESARAWQAVISTAFSADVIAADPLRGVWVAGATELSFYDAARWHRWPVSGCCGITPTALLVDEGGRIWMGTVGAGVWTTVPTFERKISGFYLAPDWQKFSIQSGLPDGRITALARGPDGRIYAAHHEGISVFDPSTGIEHNHWSTLPGSDAEVGGWVNALTFAPAQAGGGLWAGYFDGPTLRLYQDNRWTEYELPLDVESKAGGSYGVAKSIGALLVDDDGTLWVGTSGGLWRWPGTTAGGEPRWERVDVLTRNVLALIQDAGGHIWVGGQEGIVRLGKDE
jgi:hypothetical protein